MKTYLALVFLLAFVSLAHGQSDLLPHPYAFAGSELMGGGYASVAAKGGAGLRIDSRHLLFDASASYDNGHKVNDNEQPNPSGHDRALDGTAYIRVPREWFFGGGARWSQLSTTKYTKTSWRPTIGGGRDYFAPNCTPESCLRRFSMRISADYVMPGSDWQNGSQGPLFSLYMPSPSIKKHIFYRETFGVYRVHETVTDRTNRPLTEEQTSNRAWNSFVELTIMYRF